MLERTRASLESSPIIMKNGYPYVVNPILDGVPRMDPDVLREITDRMLEIGDFDCDLILAPEAMALPFASIVSLETNVPYAIIRKRSYGFDDEIRIDKSTGYATSSMYINDINPGERIAIIDDVVSTGGTLKSIVDAIRARGCEVTELIVAVNKSADVEKVSERLGIRIKYVIGLDVADGRPVCKH
jgi:adenine phosphoribosyltransferase